MKKLNVNGIELDVEYTISENDRVVISKVLKNGQQLQSNSQGQFLIKSLNNMFFMVKRTEILKALPEYNENLW